MGLKKNRSSWKFSLSHVLSIRGFFKTLILLKRFDLDPDLAYTKAISHKFVS